MNATSAPVYVVDDDVSVRESVGSLIRSAGYRAETFASAQEFLASPWAAVPSCLVLDVELPGLSGLDLQQELAKTNPQISIVFLTGHGDIPMSVRAIKAGALEFLTKPPADEVLLRAIRNGLASGSKAREPHRKPESDRQAAEAPLRQARLDARLQAFVDAYDRRSGRGNMIGRSPGWREVLKKATKVAATPATVFLQGESGTGKEVVARFIHGASPRKDGPFVAINCAALPEPLLESELFGYERGAFTGAVQTKVGQIEQASAGVLFLDEVSEMSPGAQAKFLRVLQEREFQRLGGTRLMKTNARVIAATNRDLRDAVARGAFREDLYYRLQVFDIQLPPLRDRQPDIPVLIDAFLEDVGRTMGCPVAGVAQDAMDLLLAYRWPGNVRELRNVLERAAILCDGGPITPEHLALYSAPAAAPPPTTDLRDAERRTIEQVLRDTDWNKAKAARQLGLTRTQLYVRIRKYDLEKLAPV